MRPDAVTTTISRCAKLTLEEDAELQALGARANMKPDAYVTMIVKGELPGYMERAVDGARPKKEA